MTTSASAETTSRRSRESQLTTLLLTRGLDSKIVNWQERAASNNPAPCRSVSPLDQPSCAQIAARV